MNPEKIGRYEIKSELGRGGMATVYRAYDPRFEREVALKVLPREFMHDGSFRVRFEREAKTIASLEHPAIVPVYDVGEDDGQPYFVMRLMPGGSLSDSISKGPMPLKEAARIMNRLGPALDEAHAKGIIHRDLKPGNILFDRTNEPYVSDFGIAKIAQSQSSTVTGGAIIGTPAYMSPEQAQGDTLDGRSDIYALGVILYEMLAGAQPYQATTPMAVVVKHITDPIPHILDWNPNLPAGIEAIIEKAMAKNPDQRFSTAGEMAIALNALAQGNTAEDALKTAILSVSHTQASKTRMAGKADATKLTPGPTADKDKKGPSPMSWILPVAGVAIIGFIAVVAVGVYFLLNNPLAAAASTPTTAPSITETLLPDATTTDTNQPTGTLEATVTVTQAAVETGTPTPSAPALAAIGGADMIAFLARNDVWVMNADGSNLRPLTEDKGLKKSLQWMPGGEKLAFISGYTVYSVDLAGRIEELLVFRGDIRFFNDFRISPDGKQAAVSAYNQTFIVPFDLEKLKAVNSRDGLVKMKGCISYKDKTLAAQVARQFRWPNNGNKWISWEYRGRDTNTGADLDIVNVVDISGCNPDTMSTKEYFPNGLFKVSKPDIVDYDWDGNTQFVFNTFIRNVGWGDLYYYNSEFRKGNQLEPLGRGKCCYRNARWSPDGLYLFFAFQDRNQTSQAATQLYYVPYSKVGTGADLFPIQLPEELFPLNQQDSIEFALRPAKP
jgi:serine/threonine protein kinase